MTPILLAIAAQMLKIQVTSKNPGDVRLERAELVDEVGSYSRHGKLGKVIKLSFKIPADFKGVAWVGSEKRSPYILKSVRTTSIGDELAVYVPTNYPPKLKSMTFQLGPHSWGAVKSSGPMRKKNRSGALPISPPPQAPPIQPPQAVLKASTWVISNLPSHPSPLPPIHKSVQMLGGLLSARAFITPENGIFLQVLPPMLPDPPVGPHDWISPHGDWSWKARCLPPFDQIGEDVKTEEMPDYPPQFFNGMSCESPLAPYFDRVRFEGALVHYREASKVLDVRFHSTPGEKTAKGQRWVADDTTPLVGNKGLMGTIRPSRTPSQNDYMGQNFVDVQMDLDASALRAEIRPLLAILSKTEADRIEITATFQLDGYEMFLGEYRCVAPDKLENEVAARPLNFSVYGADVADTTLIRLKITVGVIDLRYPFHLVLPVVDPTNDPASAHSGIVFATDRPRARP